jgi:hypothetical protein
MILSTLVVEIVGDISKYLGSLDKARENTDSFSSKAVGGLSAIGGGIVAGGIAAAGVGVTALGLAMHDWVEEASAAQGVGAQTDAVIQSTGSAAGMTAEAIASLAGSLAEVTTFEDDAIQSGENMLLTFTGIGKDVFPTATKTMLDMSQALGQDLKSSAIQLGKALNDPVKGVTALQRVGVSFTEDQKTMIEEMVKSGDVMGAQRFILAELQKEFGGSAEAAGKTFAGSWTILENKVGNFKETLGNALFPALMLLITTLNNIANKPEVKQFLDGLAVGIGNFSMQAAIWLPQVAGWFQQGFTWLMDNKGIIAAALAIIGASLVAFAVTSLGAAITALGAFLAAAWPVIAVVAAVGGAAYILYTAWEQNWGGIQKVVEAWWTNLQLIWALVQDVFTGNWRKFGEDLRKIWDNTWSALGDRIQAGLDFVKNLFTGWFDGIKNKFAGMSWGEIGLAIIQGIGAGFTGAIGWLIESWKSALGNVLDVIKGFLGISSPSVVMKEEVGWMMGAGMMEGWNASVNQMAGLMPRSMGKLVPAISGAGRSNVRVGGGGIEAGGSAPVYNVYYTDNSMLSVSDEQEMAKRLGPIISNIVGVEVERKLARRGL